ncbi:hypothetical protein GCM10007162_17870 [Ignatzschineria ureiclastica]|nr:hypothetical protein GCM10007162_17870 [Ignatzschineria ureiclastica]
MGNSMINQNAKKQLLDRLEQHYISPLTEFYVESEVLKRKLEGRPPRRSVSMPDSWRGLRYQKTIGNMSAEDAYRRLEQFLNYLDQGVGLVFARDTQLEPHRSIPYFEWHQEDHLEGINQLIGQPHLLYFYKGNEEGLQQLIENMASYNISQSFSVIGTIPAPLQIILKNHQIRIIDNIEVPFIEQLLRTRSLTGFFNQGIDLILLDADGIYRKGFSRTEWLKNSDQLYQDYFKVNANESADKNLERSE